MNNDIIKNKRLILVCGSGGVGKTTTAAAIALKAAGEGRRALVLTIDPARRLATALGLKRLGSDPSKVKTGDKNGELWAMMLDTKSTFDHLVAKYAPTKEIEKKILNNKIYQHLSGMVAGSQEYMAMEKLHELATDHPFDLIVVDTPPTIHAIDFLEAPGRMIDALGHSMIHILIKPAMGLGQTGLKFFARGTQMVLKVFDRITGFAFLQDISEMLYSFQGLLDGFKRRAEEVKGLLGQDSTAFVLVATPQAQAVEETKLFIEKIAKLDFHLAGVICNRVHPLYEGPGKRGDGPPSELIEKLGADLGVKAFDSYLLQKGEAERDADLRKEIEKVLGKGQFLLSIPLFDSDIHDLKGLQRLGEYFGTSLN